MEAPLHSWSPWATNLYKPHPFGFHLHNWHQKLWRKGMRPITDGILPAQMKPKLWKSRLARHAAALGVSERDILVVDAKSTPADVQARPPVP